MLDKMENDEDFHSSSDRKQSGQPLLLIGFRKVLNAHLMHYSYRNKILLPLSVQLNFFARI